MCILNNMGDTYQSGEKRDAYSKQEKENSLNEASHWVLGLPLIAWKRIPQETIGVTNSMFLLLNLEDLSPMCKGWNMSSEQARSL